MTEKGPKHTETRKFSRQEINWHRTTLPPGSARMILGVASENMGQPLLEISEENITSAQKRDIKKEPFVGATVHAVSDAQRPHVAAENIDVAGKQWSNEMAAFLQDRTKVSREAAKILNKKFDLDLDLNFWNDERKAKKHGTVRNRVETVLWNGYFSGNSDNPEKRGQADFDAFIKDFVGNDSYSTIITNLKITRSFLGIFGGETTMRQLEDAILAYAALQATKPFSRERMHLIDYAAQRAQDADSSEIEQYQPDAAEKVWTEERWLPRAWKQKDVEHARRLKFAIAVEKGQPEEASYTTVELGSKNWFKFAYAQQVASEELEAYLSPDQKADVAQQLAAIKGDNKKQGMVYVKDAEGNLENIFYITEDKDKPNEPEFYQIRLRGQDLPYFSEKGKLYHITPVKGEPYWAWYQHNDPVERQKIDQKLAQQRQEAQKAEEKAQADLRIFRERVESLRNEGWEPVALGIEVSLPKLDEVLQQLPSSEQEAFRSKMNEAITKVQDANAQKGYEFFQFTPPAEGDTPGKTIPMAFIRRFNNEPVLVAFDPEDMGDDFNPDTARIFFENGQYELWQPEKQHVVGTLPEDGEFVVQPQELAADVLAPDPIGESVESSPVVEPEAPVASGEPVTTSANSFGQDGQRRTGLA